ncbi:MAG: saccharopine dehydrogenase C-terminal domain-containing protein [Dethiobacteria bacterium]
MTFPEPLGEVTFYDIGHPEPITIPRFITGIKTVTNKGAFGPSTKTIRDIVQAELWREEPVKVGAHLISPAEFTVAFLQQNPHLISPGDSIELGALYVSVTGKKAGEMVKYEFMSVSSASMGEGTGLPAAAAAILLGSGKIKQTGVIAPECIDPSLLLTPLAKNPVPEGQVNSGLIIRLTRENGEINVLSPGRPLTIPSIN